MNSLLLGFSPTVATLAVEESPNEGTGEDHGITPRPSEPCAVHAFHEAGDNPYDAPVSERM